MLLFIRPYIGDIISVEGTPDWTVQDVLDAAKMTMIRSKGEFTPLDPEEELCDLETLDFEEHVDITTRWAKQLEDYDSFEELVNVWVNDPDMLAAVEWKISKLERVEIDSLTQKQVDFLHLMTGLTQLTIVDAGEVYYPLDIINELTKLEELSIRTRMHFDCSWIRNCRDTLKSFSLESGILINSHELWDVTGLTSLVLDYVTFRNVAGNTINSISNLTNLTRLSLETADATDISELRSLTKLTFLNISDNDITDTEPLSVLTNLKELYLDFCNVTDIGSLSSLTELEVLSLCHNLISRISVISDMPQLRHLWLDGLEIECFGPVLNLTNLESLGLHDVKVPDLSIFSENRWPRGQSKTIRW